MNAFGDCPTFFELTDEERQDIDKVAATVNVAQMQEMKHTIGDALNGDMANEIMSHLRGLSRKPTDAERLLQALE